MKQRSTTPVSASIAKKASLVSMAVLMASAGLMQLSEHVAARDFNAEIQAKEREASQYSSEATRLGQMADSLQAELDKLNGQIADIQAQIAASQKKRSDLDVKIKQTESQIKENRQVMGYILADIDEEDKVSTVERFADSENLNSIIRHMERLESLRTSVSDKITEIEKLQKKLEEDKKAVEQVIAAQEAQNASLAAKQSEKAKLVADTKNDQNAYASLANTRNSEAARLREEQKKSNCQALGGVWSSGSCLSRSGGGSGAIPPPSSGNGGYPAVWANAPMDSLVDNWGMYNRECVSYVAWKIANSGKHMPYWGGRGHAYQWPGNAQGAGIPTGSSPRAGAAAVSYGGPYGHVMYVEAVNGNGTITVSDYNLGVDGMYRYYTRSAAGLTYIYF